MKRNAGAVAIAAAVLLAASAVPGQAQFYIGVRGGLANQNASLNGSLGDIKFDKDSAALYGGQIGLKFSLLAIEAEYYHSDHDLMSSNSAIPSGGVAMDYDYVGVNGKLGIPLVVVYPYITVGYGMYSTDVADFGKDSDTGWNAGAGVEVKLGAVGLFGELRYSDFSVVLEEQNWDFGGIEFHFGLNIHF